MSEWCKEHVRILIEEYKKHPCLYEVKDAQYHNKKQRLMSLEKIRQVLCEFRPDTTIEQIKAKFSSLRSHFGDELRKSKVRHGEGTEETYVPRVWWFTHMHFLKENVTSRKPIRNSPIHFKTEIDPESVLLSSEEQSESNESFTESEHLSHVSPVYCKTESSINKMEPKYQTLSETMPTASSLSSRKRKVSIAAENDTKEVKELISRDTKQNKLSKGSSSQIFGEFVGSQLGTLRNVEVRARLEIKILKLIIDSREEDINETCTKE